MNEINQGAFVSEGRRNFVTATPFEDEAGLGAVDTNLFHIWVCEVLRQRTQRCHRRKDSPQQLLGVLAIHRRHGASLLFIDHTTDELMNPLLIVDPHPREIAPCQLGSELGLHTRADLKLDYRAIACGYCHLETADPVSG
jgi:hypothetical protein